MRLSPLLILCGAFILGILLERFWQFSVISLYFVLAGSCLVGLWLWLQMGRLPFYILCILFLLLGMWRLSFSSVFSPHDIFFIKEGCRVTLVGQIVSLPQTNKFGTRRFLLKVAYELKERQREKRCGRLLVVFKNQRSGANWGDWIKVNGELNRFSAPTNPVGFSFKDYQENSGIYKQLFADQLELIKPDQPPFGERLVFNLQQQIVNRIYSFMPAYQNLLGSMLLGLSVTELDGAAKEKFKKAGVSHLLVASGMQCSIMVGTLAALLASFKMSPRLNFFILSFVNCACYLLVGAGVSIARAALMFEMSLLAKWLGREQDFFTSICLAAVLILLVNPGDLFAASLQLSFAATIGVVCLTPFLEKHLFRSSFLPLTLQKLGAVSLAPLLLTYPICAYHFNQISLVAFMTNLVVLPFVSGLVIFAAATLLCAFVFLPLAKVLGLGVFAGMFLLDRFVGWAAVLPGACFNVAGSHPIIIYGVYAALCLILQVLKCRGRKVAGQWCAILFGLALLPAVFPFSHPLEILFLDVGQGDAVLICTPDGKHVLVDGGEVGFGKKVVLPVLQRKGINKLDAVILTHPHLDHVGGLPEVLQQMQVAVYFDGGGTALLPAYQAVLALVKKKNIFYQTLKAGDHFDCGAVNFYVLGPPSEKILSKSPVNNNSVVVRLKYKNVAILLAGDAENEEEESILNLAVQLNLDIKSNVIKIGHHGSATATSYEFLCAVAPEMAIISCGTHNRFSHPHGATLSKLAQAGIQIFRTDKRGALWLETEGVGVRCNPTGGVL